MLPVSGQNINIYKYDAATATDILVACSRSCVFQVEQGEKIVTSINSAWYEESRPDIGRWQIDIDGLIILENYSYLFLLNMQVNRETNTFKFVIDNGTIGGLVIVSGTAWLKNLRLSGTNKEVGSYACSLKGTGGFSLAGTQITPSGYVISGTTISVLQWTATGGETSHVFSDGIARTMIYGSRGGVSFESIAYTGSPSGNGAVWTIATGLLTVDSGVPFAAGEKVIILVQ